MTSDPEKISPTGIFSIALLFLGSGPSLWLTNVIIDWFDMGSVVIIYIGMILAAITLPLSLIFFLWFLMRMRRQPEAIRWKTVLAFVGMSLLIGNALCLTLFWDTYRTNSNIEWK